MKKIFFILSIFLLSIFCLFSSSIITKASESNSVITIYKFNGDTSVTHSTDFVATELFTSFSYEFDENNSYTLKQTQVLPGWRFLGYYQAYSIEPELIKTNSLIKFEEGGTNDYTYYEWWVKETDYVYYIYYNQNELPQEYHISEHITFEEFCSEFPQSYLNFNAENFYNDSSLTTEITLSELYDIYFNSLVDGNKYTNVYAKFGNPIVDSNNNIEDSVEDFLNNPTQIFIVICILLFVLMLCSLFTVPTYKKRRRRYR